MSGPLLILGAGGHGRAVADTALQAGYERVAFLDDAAMYDGPFTVLGPLSLLQGSVGEWPAGFVAIGPNARRLELFEELHRLGYHRPTLVHPSAIISGYAEIGAGALVGRARLSTLVPALEPQPSLIPGER